MPRRRMHPLLVAAMIAAVTGAAGLRVAGEGRGRATEQPHLTDVDACWGFTGFICGKLSVPLDHGGRVPGRLSLAVAVADTPQVPRRRRAVRRFRPMC